MQQKILVAAVSIVAAATVALFLADREGAVVAVEMPESTSLSSSSVATQEKRSSPAIVRKLSSSSKPSVSKRASAIHAPSKREESEARIVVTFDGKGFEVQKQSIDATVKIGDKTAKVEIPHIRIDAPDAEGSMKLVDEKGKVVAELPIKAAAALPSDSQNLVINIMQDGSGKTTGIKIETPVQPMKPKEPIGDLPNFGF